MSSFAGKHLVILGCGYVGTAVALEAVADGMRVMALTRNAATASALRAAGVDVVVADLATDAWHAQIAGAPDFLLNCVSSGDGGIDGYRRSYVAGMASMAAWLRRSGPAGTVVYTSSTSVYPQGDGAVIDETTPTDGAADRGQLLLEAEARFRATSGVVAPTPGGEVPAGGAARAPLGCVRWFVLRLAGIYGPGRHHLIEQVRAGEVSGTGAHHLNLIHRDDIAAAIRACFDASSVVRNEIFNVADDGAATKAEVVTWLAERLAVPVPRFTGNPAGGRRMVTPDRIIANAKLKARLGWRPIYPTFREGYAGILSR